MRRPAGMSVVELLIASGVGMLALAAAFFSFWPAHDFFQQANQTSALYNQALVALDRLAVEIEEAGPWVVEATSSNPPVLALPSARDAENVFRRTEDGKPAWRKWILYYVSADSSGLVLLRREVPGVFPPDPTPWMVPQALLTPPGSENRVVCRNLSLFRVVATQADSGGLTCQVELVLSQQTRHPVGALAPLTHTARFQRTALTRNLE